uniref:Uncharacterized protein n=1 Tax=Nelumbo nucifera TaxID=4432 RepID=A0A822ZDJ4_NELNU|nr:TPA_asm: hypothetical protein HUJ06_013981 [Nelumbo nucifera]
MQWVGKVVDQMMRGVNNNTVINVFLVASFAALTIRSVNQQKDIQALEAEKDSLLRTNKAMKKAMWDWKQKLFAEATDGVCPVPLSRLRAIYGEAPTQPGDNSFSMTLFLWPF